MSKNEICVIKKFLIINEVRPGMISRLSDNVVFNHDNLSINSSILTIKEMKLLFDKSKISYLVINNLKILDDHLNELSKEEAFRLILESFTNTTTDDRVYFSFDTSVQPPNWLEILNECGYQFSMISISIKKPILLDPKLLHRFISSQRKCFGLDIYVHHLDPYRSFGNEFFKYFEKIKESARFDESYFSYNTFEPKPKELYFKLK